MKKGKIPHYQLAIEMSSIRTKKKLLESLEKKINGHISVNIQFNINNMKDYCTKEFKEKAFILPEYFGKIYKHEWDIDFLERKPRLKKVLEILLVGKRS